MHVSNVLNEINGVKTEESILLKAKLFIHSKHSKLLYTITKSFLGHFVEKRSKKHIAEGRRLCSSCVMVLKACF